LLNQLLGIAAEPLADRAVEARVYAYPHRFTCSPVILRSMQ
jgi:hypothetical protein